MKAIIILEGTPKEIAALVVTTHERQDAELRDPIADCLERIEKALPGGTQEALSRIVEREVNQMFQSALSDHTRVEYK